MPMTDAERQRKRRAALKAAKEAKAKSKDTTENGHAVTRTGRNGHQDPAEGKTEEPKPNGSKGARASASESVRHAARKSQEDPVMHAKPSKDALYQRARRERLRAKAKAMRVSEPAKTTSPPPDPSYPREPLRKARAN